MSDQSPLTILGAGYVGAALRQRFPAADATRRQPDTGGCNLVFRLEDESTWGGLTASGRHVVWTFPATPLDLVQSFHARCLRACRSLIVLGSTSCYRAAETDATAVITVDERSPLDLDQPRVQGEEWLRRQGATVLQLAGIFGPGREPAGWLQRGRIPDGAKLVNLIHVDDIVAVIAYLLVHPLPGERINVANGEPIAWRELAARFRATGLIPADFILPESGPHEFGKRVDQRLLQALMPDHGFRRP